MGQVVESFPIWMEADDRRRGRNMCTGKGGKREGVSYFEVLLDT